MHFLRRVDKLIFKNILTFKNINTKADDGKEGIVIDEERIKKKMEEIKMRKQNEEVHKKKTKMEDFMRDYKIPRKVKSKIDKFRQETNTQSLFDFQDVSLDDKPTILQISYFSPEEIIIDQVLYPPTIIVTPNQVLNWEVPSISNLTIQHFKILDLIRPIPTYLVIGCNQPQKFPRQVHSYLRKVHGNLDVLTMFEAISNFNIVVNDDIQLMGFFISN